ncbi:MAG: hypothetical protein WC804_18885 [Sphingomonas sp.]|jgi:peptidoglycan/LPS O-acetylase OafA/YrhL|uniref:hypothetical protein n=1 Tax=Sphingomonas sp. TaxID=28214 RepID=UPI003561B470
MLLSARSRRVLQTVRLVTALALTVLVIAIWTIPSALKPWWVLAAFIVFGLPGAVATFMVKADNERRTSGS